MLSGKAVKMNFKKHKCNFALHDHYIAHVTVGIQIINYAHKMYGVKYLPSELALEMTDVGTIR